MGPKKSKLSAIEQRYLEREQGGLYSQSKEYANSNDGTGLANQKANSNKMTDTDLALKFVRVGKIARRVPKALLDQKKKFLDTMKLT